MIERVLEPRTNPIQRKGGRALALAAVCLLVGAVVPSAMLGFACTGRRQSSPPPSRLTVGFGFGGTSRSGALQFLVPSLIAEPLLAMDWNGRTQPRLATRWEWSDAGRTLVLQLRQGVVFHDGTPLTAGIVAAELRRSLGQPGFGRVQSIEAASDDQIVFRLSEPDAFLLSELNKGPIRIGPERTIGTGPFVVRSQTPEVVLDAFPRYHLGQPAISQVVVRTYETARGAWAALMRGEADFLYEVNRDAVDFVEAESRIQTFSFPRPYYIPIVFNIEHPILGRREVRQAINEALDRSEIVRTALNNRGKPADGPIWPYHWAYNPAARAYTYNPDAARIRLDAAGLRVVSAGAGQMPRRFTFKCLFWAEDAQYERIAMVVQKQLFEIGVDVEMVPMSLADISKHLGTGSFDAILSQMVSGRSLDYLYWFWRSAPAGRPAIVRSGYTAADAALDRLRAAQTDEDTRFGVADLQRILYEDPPAAFLVRPETARAVDHSFVVPAEEKGRDILGTLWQWKPRHVVQARARR